MPHRRAIQIVTTLLTVVTAVALFSAGWVLSSPDVAYPGSVTIGDDVHVFYDAVNVTIRTGDPHALEAVVDPHLVVHGTLSSVAADRAGLVQYFLDLHAIDPQLNLAVVGLSTTADRAVVNIKVEGEETRTFLGSPLPDRSPWGTVDAFLISNHQVRELWTDAVGIAWHGPIARVPVAARSSGSQAITLDRLRIEPGATFTADGYDELRWLIGEQRGVTVTFTSTQTASGSVSMLSTTSGPLALATDQILAVPPWSTTQLHNGQDHAASLLVLTMVDANPLNARTDSVSQQGQLPTGPATRFSAWRPGVAHVSISGVTIATLTGGVGTDLPSDDLDLAVTEATLAPNAEPADLALAGPCLLVVNAGQLDLATPGRATTGDTSVWRYFGKLEPGEGALLIPCAHVDLRNRGSAPVIVAIIAFLPQMRTQSSQSERAGRGQ